MSRRNPKGDGVVKRLRLWLRALRKDARREADERRVKNSCMVTIYDKGEWTTFRYSEWKYARHSAGVRKGTIL